MGYDEGVHRHANAGTSEDSNIVVHSKNPVVTATTRSLEMEHLPGKVP